ncbi:MAG: hypothetical protein A3C43_00125 [Candidatus Schekmanbacteria bacterium RIFCSPHIGHO2_02_FULL_38_11]|uniref:Sulfatase N-terminal domain-containing protein n=1 Tax=Candidatus Schekmanbacteria bacterium RIFCSPLOWO2_12_FULL_38_15 TaxID=1817883 RepID=A0A1F7SLI0_9BACT|nr:MAG: hypothetical protein A2043_09720 [Candidatus Schekmanbacteria bacterium GWA2_38_9]OGL51186.1 MAG: hypothetical protein A3H37_09200 [Candidatus Schekmanbacteria bacterium RIFCSPLOWO2_02_FULL_38_14]OGL54629.1 MAG: hypothetical protein A3G31_12165 [Candidatus Schekmanbacteria bacterium RIFCSPLOWO2_12_FULL_38_15]OGL54705.1 MAG: hypothetical protein A3C43_00125 [Candidatus Schekmanbacteria bacterium RIFCSPHIGHO2_02_FULL_38_11]
MNRKYLILIFILLGFIIGITFGAYEIIKFTAFKELDNERNKIKFDYLLSTEKVLLGIYLLSINSFGFTIIMFLPVIPVCLLWNLYKKDENNLDKVWPVMAIYWGLYSEIIFINWGLPFLNKIRPCMSNREIVFHNLILYFVILIIGLLSFHLSFRIYNATSKGYWFFILVNFLFLAGLTMLLRFFFVGYFIEYVPRTFRSINFLLSLFILFSVLSLSPICYERIFGLGKKSPQEVLKPNSKFLSISKFGIASVFILILLIGLTCFGYFEENREIGLETFSAKNSVNTVSNKDYLNVILILIDTLRADHLSCYGYGQNTSPNIDKLAKEGVLFTNSFSQASWTKSSVASLFTSLYPTQHNTNTFEDILPDRATTIAEILKSYNYTTAAFIANPIVGKPFNFQQGFDLYIDEFTKDKIYYSVLRNSFIGGIVMSISRNRFLTQDIVNADILNSTIVPWLRNNKDKKFFLYLHYKDPHSPYKPPDFFYKKYVKGIDPEVYKGNDRFDINRTEMALYDGEIEFTDLNIGELLKTVDELNLTKNTLVILLSDHGEAFLEHGNKEHGFTLYQEEIFVPLIMRLPGYIPVNRKVVYQVCTIDILPTILNILNIQYKGPIEGKSLLPLIKDVHSEEQRDFIFLEELFAFGKPMMLHSLRMENYKYIFTKLFKNKEVSASETKELFNLQTDSEEFLNIIKQKPEELIMINGKINHLLEYINKTAVPAVKTKVDEKTKDQIRALGYIQ